MSKTIFIADLHLDRRYPRALSAFQHYFAELQNQPIDAVYILGDLFDYWLGDDCIDKTAKHVANILSDYNKASCVPLLFTHGNRDFLLGEHYAASCRMEILAEHTQINLYGIKTLVLHGDTLCTDDADYQQFRIQVRSPQWQAKILKLPAWLRRLKAGQMRRQSQKANADKTTAIMDVSQPAVETVMRQHTVRQIIHGHTHRPAIHEFVLDGEAVKRCVVGDWYTQGSVLEVSAKGCELLTLPLLT